MDHHSGNTDDVRKKRDSTEVRGTAVATAEKKKKLFRSNSSVASATQPSHKGVRISCRKEDESSTIAPAGSAPSPNSGVEGIGIFPRSEVRGGVSIRSTNGPVDEQDNDAEKDHGKDLESALHQVISASEECKEYISDSSHIRFRLAHAGDASTIAQLFRSNRNEEDTNDIHYAAPQNFVHTNNGNNNNKEKGGSGPLMSDDTLEVNLALAMGDEGTPPSLFGLLVDIITDEGHAILVAAALVCLTWQGSKVLRVECICCDRSRKEAALCEKRLWLRLATLSEMTKCDGIMVRSRS